MKSLWEVDGIVRGVSKFDKNIEICQANGKKRFVFNTLKFASKYKTTLNGAHSLYVLAFTFQILAQGGGTARSGKLLEGQPKLSIHQ